MKKIISTVDFLLPFMYFAKIMNKTIDLKDVVVRPVRTSQCDRDSYMKINEILTLLVEVAEDNVCRLGEDKDIVEAKNLRWIVLNYDMDIIRTPKRGETIVVETWPSAEVSLYAIREFRVLDESGNAILNASSRWIMMDVVKRRPVAFSKVSTSLPILPERAKLSEFKDFNVPEKGEFVTDITPHYAEFDANSHVNNVIYTAWVYDTLPRDFTDNKVIGKIKIHFKKGVYLGQTVKAFADIVENTSFHHFVVQETGETAAKIQVDWKIK